MQHLAGIVLAAAHLHQVGIGAEIARAHLGVGLEAAAAHDDGAAREVVFAVGVETRTPSTRRSLPWTTRTRELVADFDAVLVEGDVAKLVEHAGAAADRMDVVAARQVELAVDLGHLLRLPGDADVLHPVHGGVGLVDQAFGQHRIDAPLRDAVEVVEEVLPSVGGDLHAAEPLLRHLRE